MSFTSWARVVEHQLVPALRRQRDLGRAVGVVELEQAAWRASSTAACCSARRAAPASTPAVPAGADDVRPAQVAGLEADHDLGADRGRISSPGRRRRTASGASPTRARRAVVPEPRELDLDAAEAVAVDDVGDDRRVDAEVARRAAVGGRRAIIDARLR